jgi:hypothetical protein
MLFFQARVLKEVSQPKFCKHYCDTASYTPGPSKPVCSDRRPTAHCLLCFLLRHECFPEEADECIRKWTFDKERLYGPQSHSPTAWLTPWSWVLLERPSFVRAFISIPAIWGTRRFITVFTSAFHLSLSWARPIQITPLPIYLSKIHHNIIHTPMSWSSSGLFPFWLPHC